MTNEDREDLTKDFMAFANKQRNGFVKSWKAREIIHTLNQMPEIVADADRFNKYLRNCLEMEGFSEAGILEIQAWLAENLV